MFLIASFNKRALFWVCCVCVVGLMSCQTPTEPDLNNPYDPDSEQYIPTPDINTLPVTEITAFSARSGGEFATDFGQPVQQKGVCISTSENPTTSDNCTSEGAGTSDFTSLLAPLDPGTTYYIRAFATNDAGTVYGGQRSFTTPDPPELETLEPDQITAVSVRLAGRLTPDGVTPIDDAGICWDENPSPEADGSANCWSFQNQNKLTVEHLANIIASAREQHYGLRQTSYSDAGPDASGASNRAPSAMSNSGQAGQSMPETHSHHTRASGATPNTPANSLRPDTPATTASPSAGFRANAAPPTDRTPSLQDHPQRRTALQAHSPPANELHRSSPSDGGAFIIHFDASEEVTFATGETVTGFGISEEDPEEFFVIVRDLTPEQKYYFRAYGRTGEVPFYGNERTVTLRDGVIQIQTLETEAVSFNSARLRGEIADDGGAEITARGVCLSVTEESPSAENGSRCETDSNTGDGIFSLVVDELAPETTYFVRAWAENVVGRAYGDSISFTTGDGRPTMEASEPDSISATSARLRAALISQGASDVTTSGYCLSTENPEPDTDCTTQPLQGDSLFIDLTGLTADTRYYLRAWSENDTGRGYSETVDFTTMDGIPVVQTRTPSDVRAGSVRANGFFVSDGGDPVTEIGFCYKEDGPGLPDTNDTCIAATSVVQGAYSVVITGLEPDTRYSFRPYATNSITTGLASSSSLISTAEGVTDIDGNVYTVVTIGSTDWFQENLRTTRYRNGEAIPTTTSTSVWSNLTSGARATYSRVSLGLPSDDAVAQAYGKLYNWHAVNDPRGLCPEGWRVPTRFDFMDLYNNENEAGRLMDCRKVGASDPNCATEEHPRWNEGGVSGTSTEFRGLPGGRRGTDGGYTQAGEWANFWTSNEDTEDNRRAHRFYLQRSNENVVQNVGQKTFGYSVRCVRGGVGAPQFDPAPGTFEDPVTVSIIRDDPNDQIYYTTDRSTPSISSTRYTGPINITESTFLRVIANRDGLNSQIVDANYLIWTPPPEPVRTVTDVDGNEYDVVAIGSQEWLARNLETTRFQNGDPITAAAGTSWESASQSGTPTRATKSQFGLGSEQTVARNYGRLYNWHAASDSRGICPSGFALPTRSDFQQLINYVENQGKTANALKSCRQVESPLGGDCDRSSTQHPVWNFDDVHFGTDDYGFAAFWNGFVTASGGIFARQTEGRAQWWTATSWDEIPEFKWTVGLQGDGDGFSEFAREQVEGYAVRCIAR